MFDFVCKSFFINGTFSTKIKDMYLHLRLIFATCTIYETLLNVSFAVGGVTPNAQDIRWAILAIHVTATKIWGDLLNLWVKMRCRKKFSLKMSLFNSYVYDLNEMNGDIFTESWLSTKYMLSKQSKSIYPTKPIMTIYPRCRSFCWNVSDLLPKGLLFQRWFSDSWILFWLLLPCFGFNRFHPTIL